VKPPGGLPTMRAFLAVLITVQFFAVSSSTNSLQM
jgi:hypothetical protein